LNDPSDFYKPSLLQLLASGQVQAGYDPYNSNIRFIDRDPKYFQSILNYLRVANTEETFDFPESDFKIGCLLKEAAYYNIQGLLDLAR
jgi:hypothetical protein